MYKEILNRLHDTVIEKNVRRTIPLLKENPRISKKKQLAVYIDGYRIRLAGAVASDHKAFCHYYGKKADKIISEFIENIRSGSYSLDFYPFKFADYIKNKKISGEAKELILLESAIGQVFMDKDGTALKPETLAGMNEKELELFRFRPRVASRLLQFEYDVERFLQEFRAEKKPEKINKKKIYLYIVRHNNEVHRHYLLAEEYDLLGKLFSGLSTEESVSNEMTVEMFPQWLQKWLVNGFFAG